VEVTAGRVLLVVSLVVVATVMAVLAHRGLLALERRGWIYYRTKGSGSMGASAMFGLNEAFHPQGRHTAVEQQEGELRGPRRVAPSDPAGRSEDRRIDISQHGIDDT